MSHIRIPQAVAPKPEDVFGEGNTSFKLFSLTWEGEMAPLIESLSSVMSETSFSQPLPSVKRLPDGRITESKSLNLILLNKEGYTALYGTELDPRPWVYADINVENLQKNKLICSIPRVEQDLSAADIEKMYSEAISKYSPYGLPPVGKFQVKVNLTSRTGAGVPTSVFITIDDEFGQYVQTLMVLLRSEVFFSYDQGKLWRPEVSLALTVQALQAKRDHYNQGGSTTAQGGNASGNASSSSTPFEHVNSGGRGGFHRGRGGMNRGGRGGQQGRGGQRYPTFLSSKGF